MTKGDIILIPFPFTDLSDSKLRPAVVLIDSPLDLRVSFITTQLKWTDLGDIEILPSADNGITRRSLLRLSKIATIDRKLAVGKLGMLDKSQIEALNKNLKVLLQLP